LDSQKKGEKLTGQSSPVKKTSVPAQSGRTPGGSGELPPPGVFRPRRPFKEGELVTSGKGPGALEKTVRIVPRETPQMPVDNGKVAQSPIKTPEQREAIRKAQAMAQAKAQAQVRQAAPTDAAARAQAQARAQQIAWQRQAAPAAPRSPVSSLQRPPQIDLLDEDRRRLAQPYDWGKTAKFSQDHKKFLERIFKQFTDYVTTKMAPLLQARVSIEYRNIKLRPYASFIQSLYEPITMVIMRVDPEHRGLMVFDFTLSFALIDKCLGGKGQPLDELRYPTEIEQAVLERVTARLISSYQEAWTEVKETKPQYLETQFNPQMVHIAKPSDTMVCVSFDLRLGQAQGPFYIVLPYEYLKTVLPKANFEEFMLTRSTQAQVSPSVAPLFAKNLEQAKVPVSVELGATELLFQELAVLEPNDIIVLSQEIMKPLKVKVNERTKFLGRPGVYNNKLSVQITKVLQEGDEEFEE